MIIMNINDDLIIFTDGASRKNPGPGGYGAVVLFPKLDEAVELGGAKPNTTNNEMELSAVITALAYVWNNSANVHIYTDSQYVMNGASKWMYGWEKKGWKKREGDPVMHQAMWEQLLNLVREREDKNSKITWHHVSGHVGIPANERADAIATMFADAEDPKLYRGRISDYHVEGVMNIPSDEELDKIRAEKKASGSGSGKAYSYLSLVDGELQHHETWAETEARVKGKKAKFRKALSAEHEREILEEWGVDG